jgi:hypothetical protein
MNSRLGYTASAAVYIPAQSANGMEISLRTGTATVYAGSPDDPSHRALANLTPGRPFRILGLTPRSIASVQSDSTFTFDIIFRGVRYDPRPSDGSVHAVPAFWRCDRPDCSGSDWTGMVIPWPAWAAYQSNARTGVNSRSVYSADGAPLYPYMGPWADGCKVTASFGKVLIVEWQRGTEVWRETYIKPGESHVITLRSLEDCALIESNETYPGFSVLLENCTPKPLPDTRR